MVETRNPRDTITYCQTSYSERIPQTVKCVARVASEVDRIVIVENDYTSEDHTRIAKTIWDSTNPSCDFEIIHKPWIDHFSAYRNRYLSAVEDGWVLVSDPDELFSEETVRMLRWYVHESRFGSKYNVVAFNSIDTFYGDNGELISSHRSSFFKELLFKYYPGLHYDGIVHENRRYPPEMPIRIINALPECSYEHIKTKYEVRERGIRNFFIGGGGVNDQGREFPEWKDLRTRLLLELGISEWAQFKSLLLKGNAPSWLTDWFVRYRNWAEKDWMGSEIRSLFNHYFRLHPSELPVDPQTGKAYESNYKNE